MDKDVILKTTPEKINLATISLSCKIHGHRGERTFSRKSTEKEVYRCVGCRECNMGVTIDLTNIDKEYILGLEYDINMEYATVFILEDTGWRETFGTATIIRKQ